MRPPARACLALLLVATTLGCLGEPMPPGGPRVTMPSQPEVGLEVTDLQEEALRVRLVNRRGDDLQVGLSGFSFEDATGRTQPAAPAAEGSFPREAVVPPGARVEGFLAFDLANVTTPATLRYGHDGVEATWRLHVSRFAVALEAADDTSFSQPLVVPGNASIAYRVEEGDHPVDVCIIEDADHETWHDAAVLQGFSCREGVTQATSESFVPAGTYNVATYCRATEAPCSFRLTVILSW